VEAVSSLVDRENAEDMEGQLMVAVVVGDEGSHIEPVLFGIGVGEEGIGDAAAVVYSEKQLVLLGGKVPVKRHQHLD